MVKRQFRETKKLEAFSMIPENFKTNSLISKTQLLLEKSTAFSVLFMAIVGSILGLLTLITYEAAENSKLSNSVSGFILVVVDFVIFGIFGYGIHRILFTKAKIQENIITDPLTKVRNRSYLLGREDCSENADCSACLLDCRLVKEIIRSNRYKKPFSFFIIDVDKFKDVNDKYGHAIGDIALKYVADKIKENIRIGIDIVGRLSGDEFYVLLPENTHENSITIAERIRSSIDSSPLVLDQDLKIIKFKTDIDKMLAKHAISISLSIGVAHFEYFDPISNIMDVKKEVLKSADVALYQSKMKGRNKVSVSPVIV